MSFASISIATCGHRCIGQPPPWVIDASLQHSVVLMRPENARAWHQPPARARRLRHTARYNSIPYATRQGSPLVLASFVSVCAAATLLPSHFLFRPFGLLLRPPLRRWSVSWLCLSYRLLCFGSRGLVASNAGQQRLSLWPAVLVTLSPGRGSATRQHKKRGKSVQAYQANTDGVLQAGGGITHARVVDQRLRFPTTSGRSDMPGVRRPGCASHYTSCYSPPVH